MSIPKCLILLSTYNGEKYIEEQLNSLLKQEGIELYILIRDDGSKDTTVSIIERFSENSSDSIRLLKADNLGAKASFFELLWIAEREFSEFDYYAFCDQDDIWLPEKLSRAVTLLRNHNNQALPLMYCSATQMVDAKLSPIKLWPSPPRKQLSMYNALVENVAVGCTTVLNRKALEWIAPSPPANVDKLIMHDWWFYLCISTFGHVVFDQEPHILYRQHGSNVLGGQTNNWISKWKKRFRRYIKGNNHYIISKQAEEFWNSFQQLLDADKRHDLQQFIEINGSRNLLARFAYALRTPFYRQSTADHGILKLIIVTGKI